MLKVENIIKTYNTREKTAEELEGMDTQFQLTGSTDRITAPFDDERLTAVKEQVGDIQKTYRLDGAEVAIPGVGSAAGTKIKSLTEYDYTTFVYTLSYFYHAELLYGRMP
jgi:hypothetical protein